MKELEEYHLIVLQPTCIKSIMRSLELLLELKVNFLKSCLGGGIGVDSHLVHRYAHLLNCSVMSMPFTYLGIPIGANQRRVSVWENISGKCRNRHNSWNRKTLSWGIGLL